MKLESSLIFGIFLVDKCRLLSRRLKITIYHQWSLVGVLCSGRLVFFMPGNISFSPAPRELNLFAFVAYLPI